MTAREITWRGWSFETVTLLPFRHYEKQLNVSANGPLSVT